MADAAIVICYDEQAVDQARKYWEPAYKLLSCNPVDKFTTAPVQEQTGATVSTLKTCVNCWVLYFVKA